MGTDIIITTDVLVVGGGLAGCVAAINAAEKGAKVVLFDKAAIKRSGNAGMGMHRVCLVHPDHLDYRTFAAENVKSGGGIVDEDIAYAVATDSLDRILDLEKYGIAVRKDDGTFLMGTSAAISPGKNIFFSPYPKAWQTFKPKLASKVKDCRVQVLERTMGLGLLTLDGAVGGRVIGAVGLNVRTGEVIVCNAKAVIMASGGGYRLYRNRDSSYGPTKFVQCGAPTNCGEGVSAAYNAGAEIVNMEFFKESGSWKDFEHWGIGPLMSLGARPIDGEGKPFIDPDPRFPEIPSGTNMPWSFYQEIVDKARGPFYMDARGLSEERFQQLLDLLDNESTSYRDYLRAKGLDLRKEGAEYELHNPYLHNYQPGIHTDVNAKTAVDGLYAAGDCHGGGWRYSSTGAFVFGARAAIHAAEWGKGVSLGKVDQEQVATLKKCLAGVSNPRDGFSWVSLEDKVRRIASEYAGYRRSKTKLERGLQRLEHLRDEYLPRILVRDPREMMRAAEVRCIFHIIEMHLRSALFRTETRILPLSVHYRVDYPKQNDAEWMKHTTINNKRGEMALGTKEPVRLKN